MLSLVAYILILLTVAAVVVLPHLIGSPRRRSGRSKHTAVSSDSVPSDPSALPARITPAQAVFAEVD